MDREYFMGLDVGTDSVGIACTDTDYNLLRVKGKDAWAVRLFNEAKPAAERRMKRTARRRFLRRAKRIDWLQDIFAPFIEDKTFFLRLNNSAFVVDDKVEGLSKYTLFADDDYTDVDFYKEYKTIFHLRDALMQGKKKFDLRLYYLAIHHIVKYRGHFLFEGEGAAIAGDLVRLLEDFNNVCKELESEEGDLFKIPSNYCQEFKQIMFARIGIKQKTKEVTELFKASTKQAKAVCALLVGAKAKPCELFNNEEYKDLNSFSLSDMNDEILEKYQTDLGDDFEMIARAYDVFNALRYEKIIGGNSLSKAMIKIYDKHASDLKKLKALVRGKNGLTSLIFRRADQKYNYCNYVGYTLREKVLTSCKSCKLADFYCYLKKVLKANESELSSAPEYNEIMADIEMGEFLPKIVNADNGLFPHQINGAELDAILKNMRKQYPEMDVCDEDGHNLFDKINSIFNFRIPYYVGPLNTYHSQEINGRGGNSWAVRKKQGKIRPWNFDEMIDKAQSNEAFMRRMTNKCSYLKGKDVLPKGSIIYQKFDVLNQLNKLEINGQAISITLKQRIFDEVFLTTKKVTDKFLGKKLVDWGLVSKGDEIIFTGKDGDFKCSMSSYILLNEKFGDMVNIYPDVFEKIILWHTLNTDKSVVEGLVKDHYGDLFNEEQIKKIKGLNFKEFGRLSKEFLTATYGGADDVAGELYTILGELYNTNFNLNELLFNKGKYSFAQAIEKENGIGTECKITYADVEDLYVSPAVRRGIWQAYSMVEEYVNAIGYPPKKIFVEVTRQHKPEKGKTQSRREQIIELYKTAKNVDDLLKELKTKTDSDLRSERLYLYFMQLGRCAYTGERIDLGKLSSDLYDVDHIIPQSLKKDDSLDNKVLVLRTKNKDKEDIYPLPVGFTNQQAFWKILRDTKSNGKALMSAEKYARLTRTDELTSEEIDGFISRQLTFTNQSAKALAELLKKRFAEDKTKIVYSKAVHVSDFRSNQKIVKCRETNDLHHARDAYLNVVVGNVFDTKFSSFKSYTYTVDEKKKRYKLDNVFKYKVDGAWNPEKDFAVVRKNVEKTSPMITRYSYTDNGQMFAQNLISQGNSLHPAKLKNADGTASPLANTQRYGGYSEVAYAYFSIIQEMDEEGKLRKKIYAVPIYLEKLIKGNEEKLKEYFINTYGCKDPVILVKKLKKRTLIKYNGMPLWISAGGGKVSTYIDYLNAKQWKTDSNIDAYVKNMTKLLDMEDKGYFNDIKYDLEEIAVDKNRLGQEKSVISKHYNIALYDNIINQLSNVCYQQLPPFRRVSAALIERRQSFLELNIIKQVKCLYNVVKYLKTGSFKVDLSLIGDKKNAGVIKISNDITDVKFEIVNLSPCGLKSCVKRI